jgi:Spy/CpxP family protein refolding chaperone
MNKRTVTLAVAAIVVALAAAPFVVAQERFHHRGHMGANASPMMMFGHLERIKEALNLSDAQVDQIKAIHKALREQNASYRESLHGGFGAVAQALLANPNDLSAAQALLDKQEQAERVMKTNTLAAAAKAINILTPDQRVKVSQFITEHQSRRQQRDAQ